MQFLGPTWRAGIELGRVPPPGAPTTSDGEGYATDGDGDGVANIWGAADAIAAAARMLAANGAAADQRSALLAYNHSAAYADEVLAIAAHYRTLAAQTRVPAAADPVGWALQWLGTAYVYGGNHGANPLDPASLPQLMSGRDGRGGYFDCSSLTSWAFAKATGVWIGDTAEQQWQEAQATPGVLTGSDAPPPGGFERDDLVWTRPDHSHVGLVATPDLLLNAPRTGRDVSLDPLAGRIVYAWARYPATGEAAP
jgi:cell wall-associated NlpC family hydrolase